MYHSSHSNKRGDASRRRRRRKKERREKKEDKKTPTRRIKGQHNSDATTTSRVESSRYFGGVHCNCEQPALAVSVNLHVQPASGAELWHPGAVVESVVDEVPDWTGPKIVPALREVRASAVCIQKSRAIVNVDMGRERKNE
jgi:hypothetical protein